MSDSAQMAAIRAPTATTMKTRRTKARSALCSDRGASGWASAASWRQLPPGAHAGKQEQRYRGPKHREHRQQSSAGRRTESASMSGCVAADRRKAPESTKRQHRDECDDRHAATRSSGLRQSAQPRPAHAEQGLGEIHARRNARPTRSGRRGRTADRSRAAAAALHATALGKPCTSSRPSRSLAGRVVGQQREVPRRSRAGQC